MANPGSDLNSPIRIKIVNTIRVAPSNASRQTSTLTFEPSIHKTTDSGSLNTRVLPIGNKVDVMGSSIDHKLIHNTQDVSGAQSKPKGDDLSSPWSIGKDMQDMVVGFNPYNTDIPI